MFNKQYAYKDISVSKSYVYSVIKKYNYEILNLRKDIKHKIPKKLPNNLIWNIDLTNITDINKNNILGVIDGGSRAILFLKRLQDKSSITILRCFLILLKSTVSLK